MEFFASILWHDGKFLGIEWSFWKVVGWTGNAIFSSRFFFQWYATEKRKQVVVPLTFWWLSLFGTLVLLSYALFYERDSVFIFAYAFTWMPYVRNIVIHKRHQRTQKTCAACQTVSGPSANFCSNCGLAIPGSKGATS